jgi:negative regulator of replication initiation
MARTIRIDDEVFKALQDMAEPLVDGPNDVLRRILRLNSMGHTRVAVPKKTRPRLPPGGATDKSAFRQPILRALSELGGRGAAFDVLRRVEADVGTRLTQLDRELLASGDIRWRKRAHFERLSMVGDGLLKRDSPHGLWDLTEQGWRAARKR